MYVSKKWRMSKAVRVCGRKIINHSVWKKNHLPHMQKRQIHPFLLLFIEDQDKFNTLLFSLGYPVWLRQTGYPINNMAVREATRTAKPKLCRTATYLAVCIVAIYDRYLVFYTKLNWLHLIQNGFCSILYITMKNNLAISLKRLYQALGDGQPGALICPRFGKLSFGTP